jgi:PKD repeat protein
MPGRIWDFGDGNTSNQPSPKHVYQSPGAYTVKLVRTSNFNCKDSAELLVIVHDIPQADFTPIMIAGDSCSVPQTYSFNNTSTNANDYLWDFDYTSNPGVDTSRSNNPTFTYTSPGIYTVALFAENEFGCKDAIFKNILVRDGVTAIAHINPIDGCEPLEVIFTDSSIFSDNLDTIQSVEWFLGDGSSVLQTDSPFIYSHLYQNYGTYNVFSVVTMTSGCSDTSSITNINVYPTPVADFNINRVNINTRFFQNLTSFVDSSITYSWTFSDGQTSNEESPTMTFEPSTTGLDSIEACLMVTNSFGCSDSICRKFWVWPTNLVVPNAFAPDLDYIGEDALFLPKGHSLDQY